MRSLIRLFISGSDMKRALTISFLLIFFILCLLPSAQLIFKFIPEQSLEGVIVVAKKPQWSWSAWFSGEFQAEAEKWWTENIGFRGALIKTVNQINFNLFKEISTGGNVKIVLGQNNFLYEKGYIANYHGRETVPLTQLETEVKDLIKLNEKLKARGISLILVISPSKATVYPEYLPKAFATKAAGAPDTDYQRIKPLLKNSHIPLIDGTEFLLAEKQRNPNLLFPPGGTHWNYYGACLVQEQIMQLMEKELGKPVRHIVCDPPIVDNQPIGTDRDLSNLMNIWTNTVIDGPTPHPLLHVSGPKNAFVPKVASIGDSFIWTLAGVENSVKLYAERDVYYYFESRRRFPDPPEPNIREKINWATDFWSKDVIIIETNEVAVNTFGFGFVKEALNNI